MHSAPWRVAFAIARRLKALHPDADANDVLPIVRGEIHCDTQFEAVAANFVNAWGRVKYPHGAGPFDEAFQAALRRPLPEAARRLNSDVARNLVALCALLGEEGRQFHLSQEEVARVMSVRQETISRWLGYLCDQGVIRRMAKANRGRGLAAEYLWLGDSEEST